MFESPFGIILLGLPFLGLTLFKDKKAGFVYILFFSLLFCTALAFLTQLLGLFNYKVVFTVTAAAEIFFLFFVLAESRKSKRSHRNSEENKGEGRVFLMTARRLDWVLVSIVCIAFFYLWQVHYNYTGKINFATDTGVIYHQAQNMVYPYPYFSDEWYSVLLVENSISSGKLPFTGFGGQYFLNLEMFFHSLLAEIFLLLGLNPLTQYTLVSIFANILIIVLAYIFLRLCKVSKIYAGFSSLLILFIASGANLPGIWNFIPVHSGIIFCLLGFCFLAKDKFLLAVLAGFSVMIFYAPLFIFYGFGLIIFGFLRFRERIAEYANRMAYSFLAALPILAVFYIGIMISPFSKTAQFVFSKLFYTSFYGPNMNVEFAFYNVIPIPAIFLAFWGINSVYKNLKWFFAVFVLGCAFWFFYSFTTSRFFIEYERVVFFVSIIVCVISGFGLSRIENFFGRFKNIFKFLVLFSIVLFLVFLPFYTRQEGWKKFIVKDIITGTTVFYPKAPANNYLTPEDIRIFSRIKDKRFLSIPWKGTVIGVATQNIPLVTKQGTISLGESALFDFLSADCSGKLTIAKKQKIDYVYLNQFNCPQFNEADRSREGFVLYEFQ